VKRIGVMEYWSVGVMVKPRRLSFAVPHYSSTPTLQKKLFEGTTSEMTGKSVFKAFFLLKGVFPCVEKLL
jgi:hypothetical protein